jgi:large subunit ribosomal protein L17
LFCEPVSRILPALMRHQKSRLRLIQKPDLMERNLVTSLFLYEAIRTTRNRARVVRAIVDRLISNAKRQETHVAIRSLNAYVTDKNASRKVMQVFCDRYKTRTSGFTTVKAVGARKGDGAQLVDLMLIDAELGTQTRVPEEKAPKAKKTAAPKKTTAAKETSVSSVTSETSPTPSAQ